MISSSPLLNLFAASFNALAWSLRRQNLRSLPPSCLHRKLSSNSRHQNPQWMPALQSSRCRESVDPKTIQQPRAEGSLLSTWFPLSRRERRALTLLCKTLKGMADESSSAFPAAAGREVTSKDAKGKETQVDAKDIPDFQPAVIIH